LHNGCQNGYWGIDCQNILSLDSQKKNLGEATISKFLMVAKLLKFFKGVKVAKKFDVATIAKNSEWQRLPKTYGSSDC